MNNRVKKKSIAALSAMLSATSAMAGSCIISGSTNSAPSSISIQAQPAEIAFGDPGCASSAGPLEARLFTWNLSDSIDVKTDKFGCRIVIR